MELKHSDELLGVIVANIDPAQVCIPHMHCTSNIARMRMSYTSHCRKYVLFYLSMLSTGCVTKGLIVH